MLEIDGASGGGQLLRTAVSLSALTGEPFRMSRIREERPEPGLRPQHVAAVEAVGAIAGAERFGAEVGSSSVEFRPTGVSPGRYEVDVGTAGCVTLVFDAVLPLATGIDGHLSLSVRGGTDVRWAPTLDYHRRVKLPLLRRHGLLAAVDVDRRGFYPVGGGQATLVLGPSTMDPFALGSAEGVRTARTYSVAAESLAHRDVAERQAEAAVAGLWDLDVEPTERSIEYVAASSPGSVITVRVDGRGTLAGFDATGARGKRAETVGEEVLEAVRRWSGRGAPVDTHMADQLLAFLAIGGGRIVVPALTEHVRTKRRVLEKFGYEITIEEGEPPVLSA